MKTVSGTVVSSKPVSLSKAARILSKFALSDNGASPAFAAYLKRASASFDELVQLQKEIKGSGSEHKGRKHRSNGLVRENTVNFVSTPSKDGFTTEKKKLKSKNKRDEGEIREVQSNEGVVGGSMENIGVDKEKSKKKRESDDLMAFTKKDKTCGDKVAIDARGVEHNTESLHESKEMTKKKKKKKRDKGEKENNDGVLEIENEDRVRVHPRNEDGGNGVTEEKKRKKSAEQRDISNCGSGNVDEVGTAGSGFQSEGKTHKKRSHEGEVRRSVDEVEIEEANEKDIRKRKHKAGADEGLDASKSKEQRKSKRRKTKSEVDR